MGIDEQRREAVERLKALTIEGGSHEMLSAIARAVMPDAGAWTVGACRGLRDRLVALIGRGEQAGGESITDELREIAAKTECANGRCEKLYRGDLEHIADRIDAEHEAACAVAYGNGVMSVPIALDESAWVKLPMSEDGDVLHIGELVDEKLPFGGYAAPAPIDTMELSRGASGYRWMVKLDAESRALISPKLLRHHHAPTVEDVLREFVSEFNRDDTELCDEEVIERFAAKLRLVDDGEE